MTEAMRRYLVPVDTIELDLPKHLRKEDDPPEGLIKIELRYDFYALYRLEAQAKDYHGRIGQLALMVSAMAHADRELTPEDVMHSLNTELLEKVALRVEKLTTPPEGTEDKDENPNRDGGEQLKSAGASSTPSPSSD